MVIPRQSARVTSTTTGLHHTNSRGILMGSSQYALVVVSFAELLVMVALPADVIQALSGPGELPAYICGGANESSWTWHKEGSSREVSGPLGNGQLTVSLCQLVRQS